MGLAELGPRIRQRRKALGLTQEHLARLAGLSRQTINGLENGTLEDLGYNRTVEVLTILGLGFAPFALSTKKRSHNALWRAAKTAGVSYRGNFTPAALAQVLTTGVVEAEFRPHVAQLLDEAPIELVVMAVEDAADQYGFSPKDLWRRLAAVSGALNGQRANLWSA